MGRLGVVSVGWQTDHDAIPPSASLARVNGRHASKLGSGDDVILAYKNIVLLYVTTVILPTSDMPVLDIHESFSNKYAILARRQNSHYSQP